MIVILSTQAIQPNKRLIYSKEVFTPRDYESCKELLLLEQLGYIVTSTHIPPWDLNTSKRLEDNLREILEESSVREYGILGPYTIHKLALDYIEGNLSKTLITSLDYYRILEENVLKAKEAYEKIKVTLNNTYGLASPYIKI